MAKKAENLGFLTYVFERVKNLPPGSHSDFINEDEIAKAASVDPADLRKILKRPSVIRALSNAGLKCSSRKGAVLVKKTSTYNPAAIVPDDPDDPDVASPDDLAPNADPTDWSFDPNYFWLPPEAEDIKVAIDVGMNVFLVGPAGSGKSSLLEYLFIERGTRPMVVGFTGEVSVDDIVGCKDLVPNPNGTGNITKFTEGFLPITMRKGIPLLIDEADATPPDVQFVLHPVLMGRPLCLMRNGAEYVQPTGGFMIAATGNTIGRGDDAGIYVGTNTLNEAYLDRYGAVFEHWYMPKAEEVRVLVKRTTINKAIAEKMTDVAELARNAMLADELSSTFSTRKLLDWAKLIVGNMNFGKAYRYSCINKVAKEDQRAVAEYAFAIFGDKLGFDPSEFGGAAAPREAVPT